MFNKVVWATDGSETADQALALAKSLTEESGGQLIAVHCEEIGLWGSQAVPVHAGADKYKEKIEGQVADLASTGMAATLELTRAEVGGVAHSIARVAESGKADVIVVGTRGQTPLGGLLVGGVTQRLLHIAPCPVLAIPSKRDGKK